MAMKVTVENLVENLVTRTDAQGVPLCDWEQCSQRATKTVFSWDPEDDNSGAKASSLCAAHAEEAVRMETAAPAE